MHDVSLLLSSSDNSLRQIMAEQQEKENKKKEKKKPVKPVRQIK